MNSRQKGARGERELAKKLREYGYQSERAGFKQSRNGVETEADADVTGLKGIHIECKRVERLSIYEAIEQSIRDAKSDELPAVFHRKNNCEWLVTMRLDDWMRIYKEAEK